MAAFTYTTIVAPIAEAQIEAALLWWARNRAGARELLVREIDAALGAIEQVPQVGGGPEAGYSVTSAACSYARAAITCTTR